MTTAELAASYVDSGWSVLPVRPDEKRPYMTNWLQYTKTRANKRMVSEWFHNLAGAGVGVVTGRVSNMVVLDIENDCPYPIEDLLKKYPTQMYSRTGSGGYHLFYQYPTTVSRVSNRVRIFEGAESGWRLYRAAPNNACLRLPLRMGKPRPSRSVSDGSP